MRYLVGWRVLKYKQTDLILDALEQSLSLRGKPRGVIHHSGRGSQLPVYRDQHPGATAQVQFLRLAVSTALRGTKGRHVGGMGVGAGVGFTPMNGNTLASFNDYQPMDEAHLREIVSLFRAMRPSKWLPKLVKRK